MENLLLKPQPTKYNPNNRDGLAEILMNNLKFNVSGNAGYQNGGIRIGDNDNYVGITGNNSAGGMSLEEAIFRKKITDRLSVDGSYSPSQGNMGQQYGGVNFNYKI